MNTSNKTVIFGGSFDPVTTAHVSLVRQLSARFGRVIVMPCAVSPFKTSVSASAAQRLDMLNMSLSGAENAEISTFERDSPAPSYTYLTLRRYAREAGELYLAVGSEMVIELERWKNVDEIASLARLYVVPRPHFPLNAAMRGKLDRLFPGRWEEADFAGETGSSSEVRVSFAMGRPDMYMPEGAARYALGCGLYGEYGYVNALYAEYGMKRKRIDHSYSTALCGIWLAKRACVDMHKAITALLLHDIGKYLTKEDAEARGVVFDGRIDDMPLPVRHAEIGAEILSQLVGIKDADVIEAVRWHTTGRPAMTAIEKVVYLADYIEPLRDFPGVDELRASVEEDLDKGLLAALKNSVSHVGEEIYPVTMRAYEYYAEKQGENA